MKFKIFAICLAMTVMLFGGCQKKEEAKDANKQELLIYCGITMLKPIQEIAKVIEQRDNCKVVISQGGSEDLYQSIKTSKKGDLYLPGSLGYYKKYKEDGLFEQAVIVGYNRASFMVAKGNPKNVTADIKQLLRKDLNIVLCNPNSGSIGKETEKVLVKAGIYEKAMEKSIFAATDSRAITQAIKEGKADLAINWYAVSTWGDNKETTQAIQLSEDVAEKKKLPLILLNISTNKELAKKFMNYAVSPEGRALFAKYGFIDNSDAAVIGNDKAE